jgi:hypothetical protein
MQLIDFAPHPGKDFVCKLQREGWTKFIIHSMAIPSLDQNGLISAGIHDASIEEIGSRFGAFQVTDRRPMLFQKLAAFVAEARTARFARWLLIEGSFVTAKADPNDIDLVLVLPLSHDLRSDLSLAQYNLVSKRNVQRRFGFDIVVVREDTVEYDEAAAFFQQVRGKPELRKGLLRLAL